MAAVCIIPGPIDIAFFRKSIQFAFRVHEAQRTKLHLDREGAMQEFLPPDTTSYGFEEFDISSNPDPLKSTIEKVLADFSRPMQLTEVPLHADILFRLSHNLHIWYTKFHHIANDGFGLSNVTDTVAEAYNTLLNKNTLPDFQSYAYTDFVAEDLAYAASEQFTKDEVFWRQKFQTLPEPLPFTARKTRMKGDIHHTERYTLSVKREVYNSMVNRCQATGVTPAQFILACMFAYLNRFTGREDIVIGTPILNRSNHAFRRTAGLFMGMMPLRIHIDRNETLFDLAAKIKSETRTCYRHQRFPYGEILNHCRSLEGFCQSIFDVTLVYRKLDFDAHFGSTPMRTISLDPGVRDETLSIDVDEYNEAEPVNFFFNYNPLLISAIEARQMAWAFETLFEDVASEGNPLIREIKLSRHTDPVATPLEFAPPIVTMIEMLEKHAAESPDSFAVICGSEHMTYGETARTSSCIASYLQNLCSTLPEQPVAVLCDRGPEWVSAMFGILKAGCAYLPIDPEVPRERLEFILNDSRCKLILVGGRHRQDTFDGVHSIPISEASNFIESEAGLPPVSLDQLAYIIYTSGTTGLPKGVLIEHRGFSNTIIQLKHAWNLTSKDRVLGFSSPMFDGSIMEYFIAFASGATLVIARKEEILEPRRFLNLLQSENVTVALMTPTYLSTLGQVDLPSLRLLGTAGEPANPADVAYHVRNKIFVNAYGPTETSIVVTYLRIEAGTEFSADRVSIGNAIGGNSILILDEELQPLPIGAIGEIYIAGIGLARGYLGRPELTAERFVLNPLKEGERLYRSGDLGRLSPDGTIEFHGRRDTQVKIRGFRVELGEIEAVLKTHPSVENAVVTKLTRRDSLVAYIVPRLEFEPRELRRFLSAKLPGYMVPNSWVSMDSFPMSTTGKVSLDALPDPGDRDEVMQEEDQAVQYTDLERSLLQIWKEILDLQNIGLDDDFFVLGGHSLNVIRLMSRLQERLGIRLKMADFFENPTVTGMVSVINQSNSQPESQNYKTQPPERELQSTVQSQKDVMVRQEELIGLVSEAIRKMTVPVTVHSNALSSLQERLWLVQQMEPKSTAYIVPFHMIIRGRLVKLVLKEAIRTIWMRHDALRTVFPLREGEPVRSILPAEALEIHEYDSSALKMSAGWQEHYVSNHAIAFHLDEGPLFRVCIYTVSPDEHILLIDIHHINADGISLDIIRDELFSIYSAIMDGRQPELSTPGESYDQYVAYENALKKSDEYRQEQNDRIKELSGAPTHINFLFDRPLPKTFSYKGNILLHKYDDLKLHNRIAEIAKGSGLSPFMVYLAAFGTLLHLHTGQDDLLVGIPSSLRTSERFEHTVGFFVNTCIARLDFSRNPKLLDVLKRTGSAVRDMLRSHEVSLSQLVQALCLQRTPSRPPLVQASLSYMMNDGSTIPAVKGLSIEPTFMLRRSAMFELTMDILMHPEGGISAMEYASDVWEEKSIRRMFDHYHLILNALVDHPDMHLSELNLIPLAVYESVKTVLEGEALETTNRKITDWIIDHAKTKPDRTAIIAGGKETSYAQLTALVSHRRSQLLTLGQKAGDVLAITCSPGLEWTLTVLASMTEGIVVVPLDTNTPKERLQHILDNCQAKLLYSNEGFSSVSKSKSDRQPSNTIPVDTAYIIYTSGTTGLPKGVCVSHTAFETHCRSAVQAYGLKGDDVFLVFAAFQFDASWEQLFAILLAGGTALIRDPDLWAPDEWSRQIAKFQVSCVDINAQYLQELLFFWKNRPDYLPKCLRLVICGGEAMLVSLAKEWLAGPLSDVLLINAYGPTEAVVTSTFNRITKESRLDTASGIVPVGLPMPGRILYILDTEGGEVGIGIPGELCIGGPCLAEGYIADQARTEMVFRFWKRSTEGGRWVDTGTPESIRLYRTGDRVRIGPDDQIEFLGRLDRQIKIRGFRIEPEEIEALLSRHPAIEQAFVTLFDDHQLGSRIVAYCVPVVNAAPLQSALTEWLAQWLPHYMMPASIVFIPEFPLKPSGKIDISLLPEPEIIAVHHGSTSPATDSLEEQIAAIWADVLGKTGVGRNENFFDIGGHSILLLRVNTRLLSELGVNVPLVELFAHPTVASMAKRLRGDMPLPPKRTKRLLQGDVAVIGMAGRFPGAANVEELWDNLVAGRESIRFFTQEELAAEGIPANIREKPDYIPAHGFMEGTKHFDADFFGYTPKEAEILDPQQRIFLEESWHALENAGYDPGRYSGEIGVFAGIGMNLYLINNLASRLRNGYGADSYAVSLANDKDFITTRVSYKLNLRGPSVNVNTACSTSLVAIHIAATSLLSGECDIALAGGVTLQSGIHGYVYQSEGISSPDGHCRAFSEDAAGVVGGSGAGIVVLKRLEDAITDNDTIHAVIKGSAINNDGADKVGFTAPGVNRQRDVIRTALDRAGLSSCDIRYVEAHGTGTPIGDPIEIQALSEAFLPDNPKLGGCFIGSIKSNIGHLDTAAGVAGFIKASLAVKHGIIPPTLHCLHPSKKIDFDKTPFQVSNRLTPWPVDELRRAGVSSFGMGGTNAHAIIEEAPRNNEIISPRQNVWCLPLSARSIPSLLAYAESLARHLEKYPDLDAGDIWYTLAEGRRCFSMRTVLIADSRNSVISLLRSIQETDVLRTDRDGRVLSGTGMPQKLINKENSEIKRASAFSTAWLAGNPDEASRYLPQGPNRRIPLPTYVFDHKLYWVDPQPYEAKNFEIKHNVPEKQPLDDWFYVQGCERVPLTRLPDLSGLSILIVHEGGHVALRWLDALRKAGIPFISTTGGGDLETKIADLVVKDALPSLCWHLSALDYEPGGQDEYARHLDLLLADIRILAMAKGQSNMKLILFSPQHNCGPDALPVPSFAYMNAVCAVLPHEYSSLQSQVLYVDPESTDASSLRAACAIPSLSSSDRSFSLSHGKLWRHTVVKGASESSEIGTKRLKVRGVYLITGGLGGIGLALAGHLARVAKARLVLVSRHKPDTFESEAIRLMEADGAEVMTAALDIADAESLSAVVNDITARWGNIDGVIHAAGIAGGSLIARTNLEEIERVVRAKVSGTRALAEALRGCEPAFVLLCSSLTASLGGIGQVAYAAANAWLDDFAKAQSFLQPGNWTSVQWDSWSSVGMAARASRKKMSTAGELTLLREWVITPDTFWPWGEHLVNGVAMLPGTAYLELFMQALGSSDPIELDNITLSQPMVYGGESLRIVQVLRNSSEIILQSNDGTAVYEHARAKIAEITEHPSLQSIKDIEGRCTESVEPRHQPKSEDAPKIVISAQSRWKIDGNFRKGRDEAFSRLELPSNFNADFDDHPLHPALFDIAISYYITFVEKGSDLMPWRYEKLKVYAPLVPRILSHIRMRGNSERMLELDIDIYDESGRLLVQVEGYTLLRLISGDELQQAGQGSELPSNSFAMSPREGIEVFLRSLATLEPVLCISTVDWQYAESPVQLPVAKESTISGEDQESSRKPRPEQSTPFRVATTKSEMLMAEVWGEVLGYKGLGIDDDLIELGADSLSALQASARIEELTGSQISMERFFKNSTIAYLAEEILVPETEAGYSVVSAGEKWEEGEL